MNIYDFLLSILRIGIIYSLITILIEKILIITGLTRGNTVVLIIGTFLLVLMKQLFNYHGPLFEYGFLIIAIAPVGANRYDLAKTLERGKWWWKSENQGNHQ